MYMRLRQSGSEAKPTQKARATRGSAQGGVHTYRGSGRLQPRQDLHAVRLTQQATGRNRPNGR